HGDLSGKSYNAIAVIGFGDNFPAMDLRHLRYFAAVAEHLNYTQASRRLHVAQPAISQTVLDLEDELGVKLLLRTKRSVQLTAAGAAFLRETTEILRHAEEAKRIAQRAARGEIGRVAIGFMVSAASPFLPRVIRAYRQRYPDVELNLSEMGPEEQLSALESGGIDVGFSSPFPKETHDWLDGKTIYTDRLMLALPKEHRLAARTRVNLRDLAGENFVQFHRRGAPDVFDACVALCGRAGFTPRIVYEANLMAAVLTLVESGLGASLVPAYVRYLYHEECLLRAVTPASPRFELRMVWRHDSVSPALAAFREIVLHHRADIQRQMET
ncbi:MAG TPA: LysR substrate-binding domain-containing protein, partial [Haliangiales bacterium]|nr:LysR substrate-binding domain-containing protein [Haliangiales bacterium]